MAFYLETATADLCTCDMEPHLVRIVPVYVHCLHPP
jgi:hypothetical protein